MHKLSEDRAALAFLAAMGVWTLIALPLMYNVPTGRFWEWLTHDAAGLFTGLLVIAGAIQIGLFWWQLRLIGESLRDAKVSAEAAREAAYAARTQADIARTALISTHRPKIVVRELMLLPPAPGRETAKVRYVIANTGASAAKFVASRVLLQITQDGVLYPLNQIPGENQLGAVELEGGTHTLCEIDSDINYPQLSNELQRQNRLEITQKRDTPPLRQGKVAETNLFFRGYVVYVDDNGILRSSAFLRGYIEKLRRFKVIEDPDYEYQD